MGTDINFNKSLGRTYGTRIGLPAFDPAAQAYFAATGITGVTQQTAIDALVKGLKSDGLWSKMKAVYPFVTDNSNLLSYTDDFTNIAWTNIATTITSNSISAPNGTTTADTMQNTTTGSYIAQIDKANSASTFTQSIYFKKGNNDWASIYTSDNGSNYAAAWFNINTGVVGTVSAVGNFTSATSAITNAGNGWYRCSITFTKPSTSTSYATIFIPNADNTFSRTIGQNTYIWGAQLEVGVLTTYQPIATTQQAFISNQFKYNLVNPVDSDAAFRLVFNGGWTHSANGATPNGTNGYADTKLVPSSVLAQNSASIGAYLRTNNTGDYCDIGSSNNPTYNSGLYLFYNVVGNRDYSRNNNDVGSGGVTSSSSGFIVNKRTNSTDMKVIRNNSLTLSNGSATTGRSTSPILISAMNRGGTIELYSNRQTAFNFVSDGLTDTEAANLYTRVQAFQTQLSRQVP